MDPNGLGSPTWDPPGYNTLTMGYLGIPDPVVPGQTKTLYVELDFVGGVPTIITAEGTAAMTVLVPPAYPAVAFQVDGLQTNGLYGATWTFTYPQSVSQDIVYVDSLWGLGATWAAAEVGYICTTPEPATMIVWSLLGAAGWLGMRVWRRGRRVGRQWSEENRQAILDIVSR